MFTVNLKLLSTKRTAEREQAHLSSAIIACIEMYKQGCTDDVTKCGYLIGLPHITPAVLQNVELVNLYHLHSS